MKEEITTEEKDSAEEQKYRVQVGEELVRQAHEQFNASTIRGLVRQSMQRGIEHSKKQEEREEYLNIIRTLSETNRELIQD